jgi:hypothetical protein
MAFAIRSNGDHGTPQSRLPKRPKPAQPSHHSDIQVTHDYTYDPAGTDLHCRLERGGMSVSI